MMSSTVPATEDLDAALADVAAAQSAVTRAWCEYMRTFSPIAAGHCYLAWENATIAAAGKAVAARAVHEAILTARAGQGLADDTAQGLAAELNGIAAASASLAQICRPVDAVLDGDAPRTSAVYTAGQLDGTACIGCGVGFAVGVPAEPAAVSRDGCQLFAHDVCREVVPSSRGLPAEVERLRAEAAGHRAYSAQIWARFNANGEAVAALQARIAELEAALAVREDQVAAASRGAAYDYLDGRDLSRAGALLHDAPEATR